MMVLSLQKLLLKSLGIDFFRLLFFCFTNEKNFTTPPTWRLEPVFKQSTDSLSSNFFFFVSGSTYTGSNEDDVMTFSIHNFEVSAPVREKKKEENNSQQEENQKIEKEPLGFNTLIQRDRKRYVFPLFLIFL